MLTFVERMNVRLESATSNEAPHFQSDQSQTFITRRNMISPHRLSLLALLLAAPSLTLATSTESRSIAEIDEIADPVNPHLSRMKIKTTLKNFKGQLLSEEEEGFFDASWVAAYEQVNLVPQHKIHRVTVVEQAASGVDDAGQYSLRGSGTAVLDLHLQVDFFCEDCVADEQNNWLQRRKLVRTRQEYRKLERALCQLLDEGSYEDLQGVECIVSSAD